ncbi:hypothetical protein NIES4071_32250 [Calothrix sp. NIES-4071]|nr:hypothetical protein NIES4071_32250 [Calothrix sp. NIES-4071]BAZ57545.1 hypothetical protein NIES4105_32190 [Calothrix sp. NIES-4105]
MTTISANIVPLKNIDALGRCYDVLQLDPLRIGESSKSFSAVTFIPEKFKTTPDRSALIPEGTDYKSGSSGSYEQETLMLLSSYDFQQMFSQNVSLGVGVPQVFAFSTSTTYRRIEQETRTRTHLYSYTQAEFIDHELRLRLHQSASLPIGEELRQAVKALPNIANRQVYQQFIDKFGTHFSTNVAFGGRAYQFIRMSREDYTRMVLEGINISLEAEGTFKNVTGQIASGTETEKSRRFRSVVERGQESVQWSGGTPSRNLDTWLNTIRQDPVPVKLQLSPLYELFTKERFPEEEQISQKQKLMRESVEQYIQTQGQKPRPTAPSDREVVAEVVTVSLAAANGQKSRVSQNFFLNYPNIRVRWNIEGVSESAKRDIRFTVMEDKSNASDQSRLNDVKNGDTSDASLAIFNPNQLYIGRLNYRDYRHKDVFTQIGVHQFRIKITVVL